MSSAQSSHRFLTLLTCAAVVLAICVVTLGAFTRLKDAGLGCPDWPTCYGYFDFRDAMDHVNTINTESPQQLRAAHKTWPEMVHRYAASLLGLIIMIIAGLSFKRRKENLPLKLPLLLFVLVCLQGALGALTVTMKLFPPVVMTHLLGGFTILTLLVILAARFGGWLQASDDSHVKKKITSSIAINKYTREEASALRPWLATSIMALFLQIALGGWTSANYAAVACTELPVCEAGWQEKLDFEDAFGHWNYDNSDYEFGVLSHQARTTIHVTHRFGALICTILIGLVALKLFSTQLVFYRRFSAALLLVLAGQVTLGISNVVFTIPLNIAVLHNAGAALLLITLALLYYTTTASAKK